MKGRKPLSREQLELRGTYQRCRHDGLDNFDHDELPFVGEPPKHMPEAHKVIWMEMVAESVPGVLRMSDRMMLEITCGLMHKYRTDEATTSVLTLLVKTLASLGFAPAERHRLGVRKPDEPVDEFEFLN